MIRLAEIDDIPHIIDMAKTFWEKTVYDEPINEETISAMCHLCIQNKLMCVLDIEGPKGFGCLTKGALLGDHRVTVGTEVAWWVEPEYRESGYGIELLKMLEKLAKDAGIKYFTMVYMESCMPEVIKEIYQKMGYNRHEISYMKVL